MTLHNDPIAILCLGVGSALLGGCTTTAYLQGAPGPVASPRATATVHLADDMYFRALRLGTQPDLGKYEAALYAGLTGTTFRSHCLRSAGTEYDRKLSEAMLEFDIRFNPSRSGGPATQRERSCLNEAGALFNYAIRTVAEADRVRERNDLQEKLVRSSEMACSLFKRYINSAQSDNNLLLGSATTLFAAAAAIVSSPVAATNWAGAAAAASGLRAEYNADAYNNQTAYVIAKAIDKDREGALFALRAKQSATYDTYPIEAAVADALGYHDRCSLYRGIQTLDESLTIAKDPGLRHIGDFIKSGSLTVNEDGTISADKVRSRVTALLPPTERAVSLLSMEDGASGVQSLAMAEIFSKLSSLEARREAVVAELDAAAAKDSCNADCKTRLGNHKAVLSNQALDTTSKCPLVGRKFGEVFVSGDGGISRAGCFDPAKKLDEPGKSVLIAADCKGDDKRIELDSRLAKARMSLDEAQRAARISQDVSKLPALRDELEKAKAKVSVFNAEQIRPVMTLFEACRGNVDRLIATAKKDIGG